MTDKKDQSLHWTTQRRKISTLKNYHKNPRKISEEQKAQLKKSLEKFNLAEIPAINTDGTIIGGHGRKKVLESMGVSEVDCYLPDRTLTPEEVKEANIRLNKNIAGEWDFDKLANAFEIDDLKEWGFEDFEFGMKDIGSAENIEVPENLPDYLSFVVTSEQRKTIEDRLVLENGETQTERLLSLCRK